MGLPMIMGLRLNPAQHLLSLSIPPPPISVLG